MFESWQRRGVLQLLCVVGAAAMTKAQGTIAFAASAWPAWDAFRSRFVSADGRVIDLGSNRAQTFSEGQAYGLFFALVANDREGFERLLRWTEDNLCAGDLTARLPAWLWGRRDDGTWGVMDANAASDADLWLAYVLGEAARLWHERRYSALAQLLRARIVREECMDLPGLGQSLLPAPRGFVVSPTRWRLNASYLPLQVMQRFAQQEPESAWPALYRSAFEILVGASPKGFAADWTVYDAQAGFQADAQDAGTSRGAYDAIRVYLWAGMLHVKAEHRQTLLTLLRPMARYVRANGRPPESINIHSGLSERAGPAGFSAALLPFLQALDDASTVQQQLSRLQTDPVPADSYYGQALSLFALGWMQGVYRFGPIGELLPRWANH